MGKSSSSVCLLLLFLLSALAAFNFLMIKISIWFEESIKSPLSPDKGKCAVCDKKLKNKVKNKFLNNHQTEETEETKALQPHKRQARTRDGWNLLPQINWPGRPKVQRGPPGLQFSPLPPSNPVISRDAWGQGESSSPRHFLCTETQRVEKRFRFKRQSHELVAKTKWF